MRINMEFCVLCSHVVFFHFLFIKQSSKLVNGKRGTGWDKVPISFPRHRKGTPWTILSVLLICAERVEQPHTFVPHHNFPNLFFFKWQQGKKTQTSMSQLAMPLGTLQQKLSKPILINMETRAIKGLNLSWWQEAEGLNYSACFFPPELLVLKVDWIMAYLIKP